jgi:hypothetical protein
MNLENGEKKFFSSKKNFFKGNVLTRSTILAVSQKKRYYGNFDHRNPAIHIIIEAGDPLSRITTTNS